MNDRDLLDAIVGALAAEEAADLSDGELERCLGGCVAGHRLVPFAKQARDWGRLAYSDVQQMKREGEARRLL